MLTTLFLLATLSTAQAGARPVTELPDLGFLVRPESFESFVETPGANELGEIIQVGARALDWVDLLQRDIPEAQREQVWRKIDRVGHEATPAYPMNYNPGIILEAYQQALQAAPKAVVEVLRGSDKLPWMPPGELNIKAVVEAIRPIYVVYSRASRWLGLYDWHSSLSKGELDMRPWMQLKLEREPLVEMARNWSGVPADERERFVTEVALVCPFTQGVAVSGCQGSHAFLVREDEAGKSAAAWLEETLRLGQAKYDSHFGVSERHVGVTTRVEDGVRVLEVPTFGIDAGTFDWIQERVNEAWFFKGVVGVNMLQSAGVFNGVVQVKWQKGALPHVNGIAGDEITMDANTPKWLEQTQITMRHEFGHVLGFPDCYVEFWDDQKQAFTFYTLDPQDAMCALSGDYLDRHREALLKAYF